MKYKVMPVVRGLATLTLFVPALWALISAGAFLILLDGSLIVLALWLGKKLLMPVVGVIRKAWPTRPVTVEDAIEAEGLGWVDVDHNERVKVGVIGMLKRYRTGVILVLVIGVMMFLVSSN